MWRSRPRQKHRTARTCCMGVRNSLAEVEAAATCLYDLTMLHHYTPKQGYRLRDQGGGGSRGCVQAHFCTRIRTGAMRQQRCRSCELFATFLAGIIRRYCRGALVAGPPHQTSLTPEPPHRPTSSRPQLPPTHTRRPVPTSPRCYTRHHASPRLPERPHRVPSQGPCQRVRITPRLPVQQVADSMQRSCRQH
jgi:hypothetical protein